MNLSYDEDSFIIRQFGIDNGTNTVGLVVSDSDIRTKEINIIFSETFVAADHVDKYAALAYLKGDLVARLAAVGDWLLDRLDEFDPDQVGIERPFSHIHVDSFRKLVLSLARLEKACEEYRPSMEVILIPPGSAKRAAIPKHLKYNSDKDFIRTCLLNDPLITSSRGPLTSCSEHEIDGVAVVKFMLNAL